MATEQDCQKAQQAFEENPDLDQDGVHALLVRDGMDPVIADKAIVELLNMWGHNQTGVYH